MVKSGARSVWPVLGLLALAAGLLVLSFLPWGEAAAVAVASPPVPTIAPTRSPAEIGRALFALKGCATCHRHDGLTAGQTHTGRSGAPDLTHYQPAPDFVRSWLKGPEAIRPGTLMPNLNLSEDEIEALLAFLQTNTVK